MRVKQVILIRRDLKMRRGKEIAQGSHASMDFMVERLRGHIPTEGSLPISLTSEEQFWLSHGMAKICLQVNSEEELVGLHEKARALGLTSHLIEDSGRTEFHGRPTLTACAIGPHETSRIDLVTGTLAPY